MTKQQDIEMMVTTYYKTFKVAQLRHILMNAGQPSSGKKAELIERLVQVIDGHWQIENRKHYQFFVGVISPIHTVYIYKTKTYDWFFTMLVEKQANCNYILDTSDKRGESLSTQVVTKSKFNEKVLSWRKNIKRKISEMMA
jgi:SAP domain